MSVRVNRLRLGSALAGLAVLSSAAIPLLRSRTAPASPARSSAPAEVLPSLSWEVHDADTGGLIPCKLILAGTGKTPTPIFTVDDVGVPIDGGVLAHDRIL